MSNSFMSPASVGQLARDFLDHLVARIGDRVDRVAEADHDLACSSTRRRMSASASSGVLVALLDLERDFVGAAVLRAAQRADRAGDRRIHVRAGAGDHARGERRRVELMLGVEIERRVHRPTHDSGRRRAVQQMQEMAADRIVVGLDVDARAVVASSGTSRAASSRARPSGGRRCRARRQRCGRRVSGSSDAEHRHAGAHHVHRMRGRRESARAPPSPAPGRPRSDLQLRACTRSSSARVGSLPCTSR